MMWTIFGFSSVVRVILDENPPLYDGRIPASTPIRRLVMVRKLFSIALLLVIVAGSFTLFQAPDAIAKKPGDIVEPEPNDNDDCPRVLFGPGYYCIRASYCTYNCYPLD